MNAALLIERLDVALGVAIVLIGAVTAWTSVNAVKRLGGLVIAQLGAVLTLAALGAPHGLLLAAITIGVAVLVIGAALIVRLQEAYSGVELAEIDLADEQGEPAETDA